MAAATTTPPLSATSSPVLSKASPSSQYSPSRGGRPNGVERKPLPTIPSGLAGSPLLRDAPGSPVRVNAQTESLPEGVNVHIVHSRQTSLDFGFDGAVAERALPRSPLPPPPPPRDPQFPPSRRQSVVQHVPAPDDKPLPKSPAPSSRTDTLSPTISVPTTHPGFDFGSSVSGASVLTPDTDDVSAMSSAQGSKSLDANRHSRESDSTSSTTQQQASTESSAGTSASSISGVNESSECREARGGSSADASLVDGQESKQVVQPFQYHHSQQATPQASGMPHPSDPRAASQPDLLDNALGLNRRLTPGQFLRRSSLPRPNSAYSAYSDYGPRGRSPGLFPGGSHIRTPSMSSRRSPDSRPSSYAELLNVPYPQPSPAPITSDNSFLRTAVGNNASLLSTQKTLEMYRQNVKKTNDYSIQYSFAVFLVSTAKELGISFEEQAQRKGSPLPFRGPGSSTPSASSSSSLELVREARHILQRLASNGYPFAQYYLADGYSSGLFNKGREDNALAFPLFVLAAKHGHAESAFRAALCYEFGEGCRKDPAKAVQFLRTAAAKRHPGAMTRLGQACLWGELGETRYREGIKWLKLAAEAADTTYPAAPYLLGCLYETGYGDDIFQDEGYAADLFSQAADLGHPDAGYRMGEAYEHGKLKCPTDPALSVHYYTGAADRDHPAAMMGLCAWYMVGADPFLEQDEAEAYEWARRSAELGYVKAQYAVGYFTENGIGCRKDILEANLWYVKAADAGDERAKVRLATIRTATSGGTPMDVALPRARIKKTEKDDDKCVVM